MGSAWQKRRVLDNEKRKRFYRSCLEAGPGYLPDNGAELELHHNHGGSPPPAFNLQEGDNRDWPALTLRMGFPQGKEELRDELGLRLMSAIDKFIDEYDLGGP